MNPRTIELRSGHQQTHGVLSGRDFFSMTPVKDYFRDIVDNWLFGSMLSASRAEIKLIPDPPTGMQMRVVISGWRER